MTLYVVQGAEAAMRTKHCILTYRDTMASLEVVAHGVARIDDSVTADEGIGANHGLGILISVWFTIIIIERLTYHAVVANDGVVANLHVVVNDGVVTNLYIISNYSCGADTDISPIEFV